MSNAVAVTAALLAALAFAVAAVIQQAAAASVPQARSLRPSLFLALIRRPAWLFGALLDVSSFLLQGLALAFGPLVLVMPLASTDLLFALPLFAWRHGRRLTRSEVIGALCTAGGMAAFLVALPSTTGGAAIPGLADWIPVLAVVVGLAAVLLATGVRMSGNPRTARFATSGGLFLALLDALTKSTAELFRSGGLAAFGHWEPYALMAVGCTGLLLVQSAYQIGSLTVSLPIIVTVEPVGSVLMGAVVFGEPLATSWALAGQIAAGAVAIAGIVTLSRSTPVQP